MDFKRIFAVKKQFLTKGIGQRANSYLGRCVGYITR